MNLQKAEADAESLQVKPENKNISVRVLSPATTAPVRQSNNSEAKSKAENDERSRPGHRPGAGRRCATHVRLARDGTAAAPAFRPPARRPSTSSTRTRKAKSVQVKPSNTNISVRVLSPGDDGDVSQENNSYADADAKNDNDTTQDIDQTQSSRSCGCSAGDLIQAAGQSAFSWQDADADAESKQIEPENNAFSQRLFSWGDGGGLSQSNNS